MGWLEIDVNFCLQVDGPITTEAYKLGGGGGGGGLQAEVTIFRLFGLSTNDPQRHEYINPSIVLSLMTVV